MCQNSATELLNNCDDLNVETCSFIHRAVSLLYGHEQLQRNFMLVRSKNKAFVMEAEPLSLPVIPLIADRLEIGGYRITGCKSDVSPLGGKTVTCLKYF